MSIISSHKHAIRSFGTLSIVILFSLMNGYLSVEAQTWNRPQNEPPINNPSIFDANDYVAKSDVLLQTVAGSLRSGMSLVNPSFLGGNTGGTIPNVALGGSSTSTSKVVSNFPANMNSDHIGAYGYAGDIGIYSLGDLSTNPSVGIYAEAADALGMAGKFHGRVAIQDSRLVGRATGDLMIANSSVISNGLISYNPVVENEAQWLTIDNINIGGSTAFGLYSLTYDMDPALSISVDDGYGGLAESETGGEAVIGYINDTSLNSAYGLWAEVPIAAGNGGIGLQGSLIRGTSTSNYWDPHYQSGILREDLPAGVQGITQGGSVTRNGAQEEAAGIFACGLKNRSGVKGSTGSAGTTDPWAGFFDGDVLIDESITNTAPEAVGIQIGNTILTAHDFCLLRKLSYPAGPNCT